MMHLIFHICLNKYIVHVFIYFILLIMDSVKHCMKMYYIFILIRCNKMGINYTYFFFVSLKSTREIDFQGKFFPSPPNPAPSALPPNSVEKKSFLLSHRMSDSFLMMFSVVLYDVFCCLIWCFLLFYVIILSWVYVAFLYKHVRNEKKPP